MTGSNAQDDDEDDDDVQMNSPPSPPSGATTVSCYNIYEIQVSGLDYYWSSAKASYYRPKFVAHGAISEYPDYPLRQTPSFLLPSRQVQSGHSDALAVDMSLVTFIHSWYIFQSSSPIFWSRKVIDLPMLLYMMQWLIKQEDWK